MSAPLNDVALAAFGTAALAGWSRFHDRPAPRCGRATGLLTGLAMGVKYPALVLAGLIGEGDRGRGPVPLRLGRWPLARLRKTCPDTVDDTCYARDSSCAVRSAVAGISAACVHTGNPVYPFFRQAFGGAGLDEVLDPIKRPLAVDRVEPADGPRAADAPARPVRQLLAPVRAGLPAVPAGAAAGAAPAPGAGARGAGLRCS